MRIVNLTDASKMISLGPSDITLRPKSISVEFGCTESTWKRLLMTPNYQNVYRFVISAGEYGALMGTQSCLPQVIVSAAEAEEIVKKMEHGIMPEKLDINGQVIAPVKVEVKDEETDTTKIVEGTKKDPDFRFDRNEVIHKLDKDKGKLQHPNFINSDNLEVVWKSSNEKIAEVDAQGKVKIHKKGEVKITAEGLENEMFTGAICSYVIKIK